MSNDIVGTQIGIYNVLYECEERANDGHKLYHVKCIQCGRESDMLKSQIDRAKKCAHVGLGGTYVTTASNFIWNNKRLKRIFKGMKRRCYATEDENYRWYGAKGIRICDEWLKNPKLFKDWALSSGYADNLTIDRIYEDKDYSPDNCRWVTGNDNAKYKSTTSLIKANGEVHTGQDWSRILGFGINTINTYIRKYGLDNTIKFIEQYLLSPGLKPKRNQSYYDLYMTTQN